MKTDEMGLEELDFEVKRLNYVIKRLRAQLTKCKEQIERMKICAECGPIEDCPEWGEVPPPTCKYKWQPKGGKRCIPR
jgi:hypothetical protein